MSHQAQALEVLLPLVQEAAELSEGGRLHMVKEDHALLDALELAKWRLKRRISDMANKNFGSIFRYNIFKSFDGVCFFSVVRFM